MVTDGTDLTRGNIQVQGLTQGRKAGSTTCSSANDFLEDLFCSMAPQPTLTSQIEAIPSGISQCLDSEDAATPQLSIPLIYLPSGSVGTGISDTNGTTTTRPPSSLTQPQEESPWPQHLPREKEISRSPPAFDSKDLKSPHCCYLSLG